MAEIINTSSSIQKLSFTKTPVYLASNCSCQLKPDQLDAARVYADKRPGIVLVGDEPVVEPANDENPNAFACPHCKREFETERGLDVHVRMHCKDKPEE